MRTVGRIAWKAVARWEALLVLLILAAGVWSWTLSSFFLQRANLLDLATPPVSAALHAELLAQMLVYKSDDFAEFKRARAEDRAPDYRTT